jgi:nitroreductase
MLCEAIAQRRSMGVARLKPDPVPDSLVLRALEAANWAPSHGETEPWRFVVFTGEGRVALGEAFAAAYRSDALQEGTFKEATYEAQCNRTQDAPVWIALGLEPAVRPDGDLRMTLEEELMAGACAVQNLHLVANAQGLAGMWLSKGVMVHPIVASRIGLCAAHARLLGFFVLGYPNIPWPQGERGPLSEKLRWVRS